MAIQFNCPHCQFQLKVKDELAGKNGKCPSCQGRVTVPASSEAIIVATPSAAIVAASAPPPKPVPPTPKPTGEQPKAVRTSPEVIAQQVLNSFSGPIVRPKLSFTYQIGVFLTSIFMVALPIIYLLLIALVGYAVYLHLIYDTGILAVRGSGKAKLLAVAVYLAPAVIGSIMVVFMIKPLFARPPRREVKLSLSRQSDPLLFAFVERLCQIVNAPLPKRIDVDCEINASASFRRGWLSMLLGNDLVLTIGMPLVAGLSLKQFAGVLAHEFGHFGQGAGMRLTYVIRSINFWFLRVVYQRDSLDEWLESTSQSIDIRIGWILYLSRLCVWFTRRILWCLMKLGAAVAGFMLRQMEFDADRYETRLVGSETFETTCRRLTVLNVAYQGAQSDLATFYREGRLADNLPKLISANVDQLPGELLMKLNQSIDESRTGMLDTHPADSDRIGSARAENTPGVFHSELPASVLFGDFDRLSRQVTKTHFLDVFEVKIADGELHDTDELMKRQQRDIAAADARKRFFFGEFNVLRPLPLPTKQLVPAASPPQAIQALATLRKQLSTMQPGYKTTMEQFDRQDTRFVLSYSFMALQRVGVTIRSEQYTQEFQGATNSRRVNDEASGSIQRILPQLQAFETSAGKRLVLALQLFQTDTIAAQLDPTGERRSQLNAIWEFVSRFLANHTNVLHLRNSNALLGGYAAHLEENNSTDALIQEILREMKSVREQLLSFNQNFHGLVYPFDHAKGAMTVTNYLADIIPEADDFAIFSCADRFLDNLISLYVRCVDTLCVIAEETEAACGIQDA